MRISVIIPAYNEAERLPRTLERLHAWWSQVTTGVVEIVVVDDGSTDATFDRVQQWSRRWPILRGVWLDRNYGKGQAIRIGAMQAEGDVIVAYDADGAFPPSAIVDLADALRDRNWDIAVGSRVLGMRAGLAVEQTRGRQQLSRLWNRLVQPLVPGLTDTQAGIKAFRREVARVILPELHQVRYLWDVEFLARALRRGYRIGEVPVACHNPPGSKVRVWWHGPIMVGNLMRLIVQLRRTHRTAWVRTPPACVLCGNDRWRRVHMLDNRWVLRCPICGWERSEPFPTSDRLRHVYGATYFASSNGIGEYTGYTHPSWEHAWHQTWQVWLRRLHRWRSPPGRLLEIGCATGSFLEAAQRAGWTVHGIEFSPWAAAQARERLPDVPVEEGDAVRCLQHHPAGAWDVVVAWDTIEHLHDPMAFLQAVARVLKPGGILALTTPDRDHWIARLLGRRWISYQKYPEHLHFFGHGHMRQMVTRHGMEMIEWRAHGRYVPVDFLGMRIVQILCGRTWPMPVALRRLRVWAPTGDMWVVIRKPAPHSAGS